MKRHSAQGPWQQKETCFRCGATREWEILPKMKPGPWSLEGQPSLLCAGSQPRNVGDIFLVRGYRSLLPIRFGVVFRATCPQAQIGGTYATSTTVYMPPLWCWWLEMDDGDQYHWHTDEIKPEMPARSVELYRSNPMPDWLAYRQVLAKKSDGKRRLRMEEKVMERYADAH